MRPYARHLAGHLLCGRDGSVWAVWRVRAANPRYQGLAELRRMVAASRAAVLSLGSEAMLLGLAAPVEAAAVAEAMIAGIPLEENPAWAEATEHTLDILEQLELSRRRHYLAVRLPATSSVRAARAVAGAAAAQVAAAFGTLPPVPAGELGRARRRAAELEQRLARWLPLTPVPVAELEWMLARAARRGVLDLPAPGPETTDGTGGGAAAGAADGAAAADGRAEVRGPRLRAIGEAVLLEGGGNGDRRRSPAARRYLRVDTGDGSAYQTFAVLADLPNPLRLHPALQGRETLPLGDSLPFPVDWCVRLRPDSSPRASRGQVTRQLKRLAGQLAEDEAGAGEDEFGLPGSVDAAIEEIRHEKARLEADSTEREVKTTFVYAVWAHDLGELERRAALLTEAFGVDQYGMHRPTGGQEQLYHAMLPGHPAPATVRHYTQYGLSDLVAAALPFACTDLGDPRGGVLGFGLDGGSPAPVLLDPTYGPRRLNRSGAIAVIGDLGAGKTQTAKGIVWCHLARGRRGGRYWHNAVMLDRSPTGEWVSFAEAAPVPAQVVRLDEHARVSLDPLRVFTGDDRIRATLGFCSLYAGVPPRGPRAAALEDAVETVAARADASLPALVDELLGRGRHDPDSAEVGRLLTGLRRGRGLARLVAGDAPPLGIAAAAAAAPLIVFHLPGLVLPSTEQLRDQQLREERLPEEILAQAVLYLVGMAKKAVAFADPRVFTLLPEEEVWSYGASPQGEQLLVEESRDGRRNAAAPLFITQSAADIPAAVRQFIPTRLVLRQQSAAAAADSLAFLGIADSPALRAELAELDTGVALLRDIRGRIGRIGMPEAPLPDLAAAFNTTPPGPEPHTDSDPPNGRAAENRNPPLRRTDTATATSAPAGSRPTQAGTVVSAPRSAAVQVAAPLVELPAQRGRVRGDRQAARAAP